MRPTTVRKMIPADPPTAQRKKNLNSALVRADCTYLITAYAFTRANTPKRKENAHNHVITDVKEDHEV